MDLTPERVLPRTKCPFYGFRTVAELVINQDNDHCAIGARQHCSCMKSEIGEIPDWETCPNNTPNFSVRLEVMKRDFMVLADEFIPEEVSVEDSPPLIPFSYWYSYITQAQWAEALLL